MIVIFTGLPLVGKGTQAQLLEKHLGIPVYSIGKLLREGNKAAKEAYEKYAMKGFNLPIELKFGLLREKIDDKDSFILENFPATQEDLSMLNLYLKERNLTVDKVIHIQVSEKEIKKRMMARGRIDDTEEILEKRRIIQDKDRKPVLDFYRKKGILVDINGEGEVNEIRERILKKLGL